MIQYSHMALKLFIYGSPGSGKDTAARQIAAHYHLPFYSVGEWIRDEITQSTEFGKAVAQFVMNGDMIPGTTVRETMKQALLAPEMQQSGFIINGYPRTIEDFKDYLKHDTPSALIVSVVEDEVAQGRLESRGRPDDTIQNISKRLEYYHSTAPWIFDYVREQTEIPMIVVQGDQTPEEVVSEIMKQIDKKVSK